MKIKLSILVPTVPSRIELFYPRIMKNLIKQVKPYEDIELISFFDNKKRSIGQKRQELINLAQGEYVVFIDDDDRISEDYVSSIMTTLYANPYTDCVVFDCICKVNGGPEKLCKYGIEFEYGDILGGLEWRGKPAHTMVYKTLISKSVPFNNLQNGEDYDWVKRAYKNINNQTRIDKVLYYYDAEYKTTSETAGLDDVTIEKNINLLLKK
jgi:glycosyltransferase involved in cell wall biosynthesis